MNKIKDVTTAMALFEEAALKHTEATEQGDYKSANKSYDKIIKAIDFLRSEDQVKALLNFFQHNSEGVRGWAATYLLPIEEGEAIKVLEEIAKGPGIRALAAETTLNEWKNGNLKL